MPSGFGRLAALVGWRAETGTTADVDEISRPRTINTACESCHPTGDVEKASDIPVLGNSEICNAKSFHLGYAEFHADGNSTLVISEVRSSWQR
jgi:hypothetical protein